MGIRASNSAVSMSVEDCVHLPGQLQPGSRPPSAAAICSALTWPLSRNHTIGNVCSAAAATRGAISSTLLCGGPYIRSISSIHSQWVRPPQNKSSTSQESA
jgi:hypothetical protein